MQGKNKISIIGKLGKDPVLSLSKESKPVCRFSVAVNERHAGEESTEWFQVICFDKMASLASQYLRKGSTVDIEGRMETRTSISDRGESRQFVTVVAKEILFLDRYRENPVENQGRSDHPTAENVEASIP